MPRLRQILFPVDFSQCSVKTAPSVEAVAKHFDARVTLLYVVEIPHFPDVIYPPRLYAAFRHETRKASAAQMERFAEAYLPSLVVGRMIEEGDPAPVIADYARRHNADLIMMPTHGYGPFRRFLTGSVAAKVLHDARCPVWTAAHVKRPRSGAAAKIRNILCAVDCNDAAVGVMRWAGWLARRYHAALEVLHVIPALDERSRNRGERELRRHLTRRAQAEFAILMDQAGVQNELLIRGGGIPARLAETARRLRADLMVIGRGHTRKALGRVRTHSLAIVRESPCPVLSI